METTKITGHDAAELLFRAVQLYWHGKDVVRIQHWLPTIAQAYQAVLDDTDQPIALPFGTKTPEGERFDTGKNIIDAFDEWLGHGVAWEALRLAQREKVTYNG
jgi:hypothetical protein